MSAFRSTVIFGCSLLGAGAIAMAVPATSNAACLLGISGTVCNNGILSSPGSTGILNLGPLNTGIGNIGIGNTGLLNIGAGNVGGVNLGTGHHGLLGLG
ncbi:MAG: hypothetical protein QOC63_3005 [Mycobacterium sp.]|jgi:hypothetical protein|nr:hypothetical protein [Mycobacterium sp.]